MTMRSNDRVEHSGENRSSLPEVFEYNHCKSENDAFTCVRSLFALEPHVVNTMHPQQREKPHECQYSGGALRRGIGAASVEGTAGQTGT